MVPEAGIAQLLAEPHAAQQVCEKLIAAALAHGGSDNVTAVLARYAAVS